MIAVAHPTPGLTEIAPAGQFVAQAPHSMQRSRSRIRAFPSAVAKTPWGQTAVLPVRTVGDRRVDDVTDGHVRKP